MLRAFIVQTPPSARERIAIPGLSIPVHPSPNIRGGFVVRTAWGAMLCQGVTNRVFARYATAVNLPMVAEVNRMLSHDGSHTPAFE